MPSLVIRDTKEIRLKGLDLWFEHGVVCQISMGEQDRFRSISGGFVKNLSIIYYDLAHLFLLWMIWVPITRFHPYRSKSPLKYRLIALIFCIPSAVSRMDKR
jgi:hypothetical protein